MGRPRVMKWRKMNVDSEFYDWVKDLSEKERENMRPLTKKIARDHKEIYFKKLEEKVQKKKRIEFRI